MPPQKTWHHLLLLLIQLSLSLAASPTSFCKCTCFTNSTLIPLDAPRKPTAIDTPNSDVPKGRTCNDCNKQFCLDYHLPMCQGAKEDDVFTTCFQRDSTKDQAVVFIFIFATGALLGWAGVKPWAQRWREGRGDRTSVPFTEAPL
ncbi:hypothetical protein EJ03DRAFT_389217 [Teratosphaeria nubilosa]|uniref:Uncharacterized protein n=1 Tax=Teratosphaeria nubilosa TaxID=161662 RepID=A0A6G1LAF8_9PEZI|nr:hypothetical protein EJ03DRAFT_389217 [Teratosphaeria nubilosa]